MVRDLIKFQPQECVQRIGREMLALRRSAFFWRRRQDHDDSSHPVPNYRPGWQTAILPSLRWMIYRCSLLYEDSYRFCPFLGNFQFQRELLGAKSFKLSVLALLAAWPRRYSWWIM